MIIEKNEKIIINAKNGKVTLFVDANGDMFLIAKKELIIEQ